jgi:hypothetical protein
MQRLRPSTEPLQEAPAAMPHASTGRGCPTLPPAGPRASCARCGALVPAASASGRPRRGARFCSSACRFATTADRRAAARADLLDAVAQLAEAEARVRRALSTLGLNPRNPRRRRGARKS